MPPQDLQKSELSHELNDTGASIKQKHSTTWDLNIFTYKVGDIYPSKDTEILLVSNNYNYKIPETFKPTLLKSTAKYIEVEGASDTRNVKAQILNQVNSLLQSDLYQTYKIDVSKSGKLILEANIPIYTLRSIIKGPVAVESITLKADKKPIPHSKSSFNNWLCCKCYSI